MRDFPQKILTEPEDELRRVLGAGFCAPRGSRADLADAVGQGKSVDFRDLAATLKSAELTLDAYTGTPANFRS